MGAHLKNRPPPRPPAIDTLLREIVDVANGPLATDYREAYEFAYLANGWRPESAGRLSAIGDGDPTGETVIDGLSENDKRVAGKERIRTEAFAAYELLGKALDNLRQAANAVQRAMPREPTPPDMSAYPRPRIATRADVAEAREAQERRIARGDA